MKKTLLGLVAFAAILLVFTSCERKPKPETIYLPQIATFTAEYSDGADQWTYHYDAEGKVTKVERFWVTAEGVAPDKEWNFAYGAKGDVTITGSGNYTITFGENGYASTFTESGDGWAETYTYTYDALGYLVSVDRDGSHRSDVKIEDNNITYWTKPGEEEGSWLKKNHTYLTQDNVAGIRNIYCERAGASRWLQELGWFGKPTAKLCSTNQWENSDKGSVLTYLFDEHNWVTQETKIYGGDEEYPEIYKYTWNVIEVTE